MNFSVQDPAVHAEALQAEAQRYYSQAVSACLARLHCAVDLLQHPALTELQAAGLLRDVDEQTSRLNSLMRHVWAGGLNAPPGEPPAAVPLQAPLARLLAEYWAVAPQHGYELCLAAQPTVAASALPSLLVACQLLLDNALRRSPAGATVEITAEDDPAGEGWQVHIRDLGAELPPGEVESVFADWSLAAPSAVYGLGLSLAQLVVEALGGQLWVESGPGRGATFSFSLPRHVLPRRWNVSRPKVLVIEENTALSGTLSAAYEDAGFEVETAASVEAGLGRLPDFAPNVVLLELPPGSPAGQDSLTTLRRCGQAAVIFLVAPRDREAVPEALWQGASDCVVKPFHIRELIARTRAILRRRAAPAPALVRSALRPRPSLIQRPKINPLLQ
jgi:CheY-like chemotaxis protein